MPNTGNSQLLAELLAALQRIEPLLRQHEALRPDERDWAEHAQWSRSRLPLAPELPAILSRTGLVGPGAALIHMGAGARNLSDLPERLMDLAGQRGAAAACEAFRFLLEDESAEMVTTMLVWGFKLEAPIALGSHIELRAGQRPDGRDVYERRYEALPWHLQIDTPTIEVRIRFEVPRIRFSPDDADPSELNRPGLAARRVAEDLVDCLVVCGPSPVVVERSWTTYADTDVAQLLGGTPTSVGYGEFKPKRRAAAPISHEAAEVVRRMVHAETHHKYRLTLACRRLNAALLRAQPGDAALDVAIALESLFWSAGDGAGSRGRIIQRARLLLGREFEGQKLGKVLEDLFLLRNEVVHGERAAADVPPADLGHIAWSTRLCAECIRRLACLEAWPTWESDRTRFPAS